MKRLGAAVAAAIWLLLASLPPAHAEPADYVLMDDEATLVETNGVVTVSYTLANLTNQPGTVSLTTTEAGLHCVVSPNPSKLPASQQQQQVTFTLNGCNLPENDTFGLSLDIVSDAGNTSPFPVSAKPEAKPDPDWGILIWFIGSTIGGLAAVSAGWLSFGLNPPQPPPASAADTHRGHWAAVIRRVQHWAAVIRRGPRHWVWPHHPLPGLGAGWSFKESWGANVALVASLFTGLFGTSDLLVSVTGHKARRGGDAPSGHTSAAPVDGLPCPARCP